MDANDVKKKFFDVTPPSAPAVPKATVKKRQVIVKSDTQESNDSVLPQSEITTPEPETPTKLEVKHELVVTPPKPEETEVVAESNESTEAEVAPPPAPDEAQSSTETEKIDTKSVELPTVDPLPTTQEAAKETEPAKKPEPADEDTPIAQAFVATDALPDTSAPAATADIQEPKIYDTTAYHVPIKETTHGHGTKSAFIFGAVFAVAVVSGLVFAVLQFA